MRHQVTRMHGTIDSRYIAEKYSTILTQYNIFECETSVRLWTHERHPYLALTGKPWVSFVSYVEESDREISGGALYYWHSGSLSSRRKEGCQVPAARFKNDQNANIFCVLKLVQQDKWFLIEVYRCIYLLMIWKLIGPVNCLWRIRLLACSELMLIYRLMCP